MYFVTICLEDRTPLLGRVDGHDIHLSPAGEIVAEEVRNPGTRFDGVTVDSFVVMPDHAHILIGLGEQDRKLGTIVASLKSTTAHRINRSLGTSGALWQRGYHDHVIRDAADLDRVREYIVTNPIRWTLRRASPHN